MVLELPSLRCCWPIHAPFATSTKVIPESNGLVPAKNPNPEWKGVLPCAAAMWIRRDARDLLAQADSNVRRFLAVSRSGFGEISSKDWIRDRSKTYINPDDFHTTTEKHILTFPANHLQTALCGGFIRRDLPKLLRNLCQRCVGRIAGLIWKCLISFGGSNDWCCRFDFSTPSLDWKQFLSHRSSTTMAIRFHKKWDHHVNSWFLILLIF